MNPIDFLALFQGSHCFQWFHENPSITDESQKVRPGNIVGGYQERRHLLVDLNERGAGIYFTVNQTDGEGRKEANITKVRALFVDLDGAPIEPVQQAACRPNIIVRTSPNKYHAYWFVADVELQEFREYQKLLAAKFRGDPSVQDLGRVMRLPGFFNLKASPFRVEVIENNNNIYLKEDLHIGLELDQEAANLALSRLNDNENKPDRVSLVNVANPPVATGSRHSTLFTLARSFATKGCTRAELSLLLHAANANFAPPIPEERVRDEIKRIIDQVEEYEGGVLGSAELVWDEEAEYDKPHDGEAEEASEEGVQSLGDIKMTDELAMSAPGLLGQLTKSFISSAQWPLPPLCLQAALVTMSMIKEKKYKGYFGGWCNLYTLGTAHAAAGKGHGLTCVDNVLTVVGADSRIVGKCVSAASIFTALKRSGDVALSVIDEAGLYFEQLLDNRLSNANAVGLRETLMAMFNAKRKIKGAEYSSRNGTPERLDCHNPFFAFYGVCTPQSFFNSLSRVHSVDGFVSRLLYFESEDVSEQKPRQWDSNGKSPLEASLIDALIDLNNLGGAYYAEPLQLEFLDDSFMLYKGYVTLIDAVVYKTKDERKKPIRGRLVEYFDKIVTIAADGNKVSPVIVNWAFKCAVACNNALIGRIETSTFETETEKTLLEIARYVGMFKNGVSHAGFCQKFRALSKNARADAMATLIEAGYISKHTGTKKDEKTKNITYYKRTKKRIRL
jgi:RepB DNA-primase from phage plasmid/Primase C terminal 1 (PriCT-1)